MHAHSTKNAADIETDDLDLLDELILAEKNKYDLLSEKKNSKYSSNPIPRVEGSKHVSTLIGPSRLVSSPVETLKQGGHAPHSENLRDKIHHPKGSNLMPSPVQHPVYCSPASQSMQQPRQFVDPVLPIRNRDGVGGSRTTTSTAPSPTTNRYLSARPLPSVGDAPLRQPFHSSFPSIQKAVSSTRVADDLVGEEEVFLLTSEVNRLRRHIRSMEDTHVQLQEQQRRSDLLIDALRLELRQSREAHNEERQRGNALEYQLETITGTIQEHLHTRDTCEVAWGEMLRLAEGKVECMTKDYRFVQKHVAIYQELVRNVEVRIGSIRALGALCVEHFTSIERQLIPPGIPERDDLKEDSETKEGVQPPTTIPEQKKACCSLDRKVLVASFRHLATAFQRYQKTVSAIETVLFSGQNAVRRVVDCREDDASSEAVLLLNSNAPDDASHACTSIFGNQQACTFRDGIENPPGPRDPDDEISRAEAITSESNDKGGGYSFPTQHWNSPSTRKVPLWADTQITPTPHDSKPGPVLKRYNEPDMPTDEVQPCTHLNTSLITWTNPGDYATVQVGTFPQPSSQSVHLHRSLRAHAPRMSPSLTSLTSAVPQNHNVD